MLQAALLLTLWVGISGGLHLDGLADSADAWVGGLGDKQRTLDIMKDPRCGPMAVLVLVLVLLLKFTALVALLEHQSAWLLILVPWLARGLLPLLFLTTPYVRPGGLGQALAEHLPRAQLPWVLAVHVFAMLLFGLPAVLALVVAGAGFIYLRRLMQRRLGGTTGDTAGALLELVECWVLLVLACVL
jgi:adenosylcobinamide-GDP ribazoletransferase